jgi:acyl-CoA thioester hydrolase
MQELPPYRTAIDAAWIDYNGHLRDAYYGLILSYATDDMMDHIGVDSAYRDRTQCTLYTLEVHIHYLNEVKGSDLIEVRTSVLDADHKRIHLGCRFGCARVAGPVAVAEAMLLHVRGGAKPASEPFPADIQARLGAFKVPVTAPAFEPGSRKLEILRRKEPV